MGGDKGRQLSTNQREHSLIQMSIPYGVCNGMDRPVAIPVGHGMHTGECYGLNLWLKHGGYMRLARRVSPSVCTAVNSSYQPGEH